MTGCGRLVGQNHPCGKGGCGQPDCDCCQIPYCPDCAPLYCRCTTPQPSTTRSPLLPIPSGMCDRCKRLIQNRESAAAVAHEDGRLTQRKRAYP